MSRQPPVVIPVISRTRPADHSLRGCAPPDFEIPGEATAQLLDRSLAGLVQASDSRPSSFRQLARNQASSSSALRRSESVACNRKGVRRRPGPSNVNFERLGPGRSEAARARLSKKSTCPPAQEPIQPGLLVKPPGRVMLARIKKPAGLGPEARPARQWQPTSSSGPESCSGQQGRPGETPASCGRNSSAEFRHLDEQQSV